MLWDGIDGRRPRPPSRRMTGAIPPRRRRAQTPRSHPLHPRPPRRQPRAAATPRERPPRSRAKAAPAVAVTCASPARTSAGGPTGSMPGRRRSRSPGDDVLPPLRAFEGERDPSERARERRSCPRRAGPFPAAWRVPAGRPGCRSAGSTTIFPSALSTRSCPQGRRSARHPARGRVRPRNEAAANPGSKPSAPGPGSSARASPARATAPGRSATPPTADHPSVRSARTAASPSTTTRPSPAGAPSASGATGSSQAPTPAAKPRPAP